MGVTVQGGQRLGEVIGDTAAPERSVGSVGPHRSRVPRHCPLQPARVSLHKHPGWPVWRAPCQVAVPPLSQIHAWVQLARASKQTPVSRPGHPRSSPESHTVHGATSPPAQAPPVVFPRVPRVDTADWSPDPVLALCGGGALSSAVWDLVQNSICYQSSHLSTGSLWCLSRNLNWTRRVPVQLPQCVFIYHTGKAKGPSPLLLGAQRERDSGGVPGRCLKKDQHICDLP